MSQIQVDNIYNKEATGSPSFPLGANVTGVITATTFKGGAEITSGTVNATSVTATTGSFTGAVSIGGTLTYEDVTNIDSVGVITARDGINVSGGTGTFAGNINANGDIVGDNSTNISGVSSVTATTYYGSGASLSGIEAAPTIQAVVNGTLAAEQSVIVNSDGKVSGITGVPEALSSGIQGQGNQASTGSTSPYKDMQIAYDDTTGRIVCIYRTSHPNTGFIVGTRSGQNITWGTAASLDNNAVYKGNVDVCCVGTDEFFVIYGTNNDSNCYVRHVTTTSSNTFSAGATVEISSGGIGCPRVQYDATNDGVLMVYTRLPQSETVHRWATWSGSTVTLSSPVVLYGNVSYGQSSWDSKNNFMIYARNNGSASGDAYTQMVYKDPSNPASLHGTATALNAAACRTPSVQYDAINDIYYGFYVANAQPGMQYYRHGSYNSSNKSITWGSQISLEGPSHESISEQSTAIDVATGKIMVSGSKSSRQKFTVFQKGATNNLSLVTSLTDWTSSDTSNPVPFIQSLGNLAFVTGYEGGSEDAFYVIKQFAATDATVDNFIGFSKEAYTNGQTGTVKVVGNVTTKSGLTPGKKYYVKNDGTLSTTAEVPSILGGKALTATSLLINPTS
jgi:hypothetical protein